ncbi:aldolase [Arthrobacter sp. SDTb3-6]|uniref:DUF6986 family protein n=1 Tax=Arthrobacter sp. SDTb3-6 TaxID=2713571 RepID=UPI00159CF805|nr:aldolase [Arthrobacter sp. SDTb3-6]NVN00697.1 aldolase [Arthrobacter sp. SDTb3-6]
MDTTTTGRLGVGLDSDPNVSDLLTSLNARMAEADRRVARKYPGDDGIPQPIHTVYIPGGTYSAETPSSWGRTALSMLEAVGSPELLAGILGVPEQLAAEVLPRVRSKLATEPIEDLRVDFEDGFGQRGDVAEDNAVAETAARLSMAADQGLAPRSWGIRFKSLEMVTRERGVRTLTQFLTAVSRNGILTASCMVTLPKVTDVSQVAAMAHVCDYVEKDLGLKQGSVRFEIQMETPQSIISHDGTIAVPALLQAADGRCASLHYGTYDYTASCGIAAPYQSMDHPASDFAKDVMQVSVAGTGVRLCDGATIEYPVGTEKQIRQALGLHARLVRRSLERGYYQGWDMHPGQLVTRFAATFAFYRQGFFPAADRIAKYMANPASSNDEPATIRALAGFVRRGYQCGAVTEIEVRDATGSSPEHLIELS